MSFGNTKSPRKPQGGKGQKYVVPQRRSEAGQMVYYLTPELEAEFRRLFPVTMNPVLMRWFGLSCNTLHRFAQNLGLSKDMAAIHKAHARQIKRICERNGYYASMRGKAPSEATVEATRRRWAEGFHPLKALKEKDPKKYKATLERRAQRRRELMAKERRRVEIGLNPYTKLHIPCYNYTSSQVNHRYYAVKRGYVPGDVREGTGERYVLYYTRGTARSARFEKNCIRDGFCIRELDPKPAIKYVGL